jgi:hypothetical protein
MKRFIFDDVTRRCIGYIEGSIDGYNGQGVLVDADSISPDVPTDDMTSLYLSDDGVSVIQDITALLAQAKAARKTRIKAEAARLIEATDWKLARAREREAAGWATLAEVDAVLAEREAIRRSSNAAEAAVDALTDVGSVQTFTWSIDVAVAAPRRLTHKGFSDRFTDAEMQAILAAAETNAALKTWWEKFKLARDINLDDPATQGGVQALEIAGLIGEGRAAEVLA